VATVGLLQSVVGDGELVSLQHRNRTSAEKLRTAHAAPFGQCIERLDQVVIELNKYLTSRHSHMVDHMIKGATPIGNPYADVRFPFMVLAVASVGLRFAGFAGVGELNG